MKDYTNVLEYYKSVMSFLIEWEQEYDKTGQNPAPYENWYFISAQRDYHNPQSEMHYIEITLRTEYTDPKYGYGDDLLGSWRRGTKNQKSHDCLDRFESIGFKLDGDKFIAKLFTGGGKVDDYYITQKIKEINNNYFKEAHITVFEPKSGGCYVATAVYGSYDCPQVWTLRRFRDKTLSSTWYGRLFIRAYYAVSPVAVKYFGNMKWFRSLFKKPLDKFVKLLEDRGFENTPYYDKAEVKK